MSIQNKTFIEGMELAMRICRNRAKDCSDLFDDTARSNEAEICSLLIRSVQVQIGAGRQPMPVFTQDEIDEIERIS